jgi:hypothetical protein
MNVLDELLHRAVFQAIQNEMDAREFQRIEQKLQDEGIKFSEFISKFGQMKKPAFHFEHELKKVEDRVLRNFLSIETEGTESWMVIKNKYLTELILKTFADGDKKMIMDLTRTSAETIPRVLSLCNLPNTSGYRKMKQLIDDGFVMPTGLAETFEGRRALLYKSIIQKIQIIINKSDIFAKILVPKETLGSSFMVKMIVELEQGKRTLAN